MPWFKVDDSLAFHAKFVALPLSAAGLWMRAGAWSAQQLTDGFVPVAIVAALGGDEDEVAPLVAAGLWKRARGGWDFHDWADYQPTAAAVKAERHAAAERMRELRARRKHRGRPDDGDPTSSPTAPATPPGSGPSGSPSRASADDVHDEAGDESSDEVLPNEDRTFAVPAAQSVRTPRPSPSRPSPAPSVESSGEGGAFRDVREPAEPFPRCARHRDRIADGSCGPCGDARREHERWVRDRVQARRDARPVVGGQQCPDHPGNPASACPACAAAATPPPPDLRGHLRRRRAS